MNVFNRLISAICGCGMICLEFWHCQQDLEEKYFVEYVPLYTCTPVFGTCGVSETLVSTAICGKYETTS